MSEPERVPYAMTEAGMIYAERYIDGDGRAWVAPCGTRVEDADQWIPDPAAK
jgi:hypothetical protein